MAEPMSSAVAMLTDFFSADHLEASARQTGFVQRAATITGKLLLALVTFGPWSPAARWPWVIRRCSAPSVSSTVWAGNIRPTLTRRWRTFPCGRTTCSAPGAALCRCSTLWTPSIGQRPQGVTRCDTKRAV